MSDWQLTPKSQYYEGAVGTNWAIHSYGFTPGLPDSLLARAGIEFELGRRFSSRTEKVVMEGELQVSRVGDNRRLLTVIADAPSFRTRTYVRSVRPVIEETRVHPVVFDRGDGVTTDRAFSVLCGEPYRYSFDRVERLELRNAISTIEKDELPGEVTRWKVAGLQRPLFIESDARQPLEPADMHAEAVRQLNGAYRVDTWGYLWKWVRPPQPSDGPFLTMSEDMTVSMSQTLHDLSETLLRATGVKPLKTGFESGADVLDAVAYALVACRRNIPVETAAHTVVEALQAYNGTLDLRELSSEDPSELDSEHDLVSAMHAPNHPTDWLEEDLFPNWAFDPIRRTKSESR